MIRTAGLLIVLFQFLLTTNAQAQKKRRRDIVEFEIQYDQTIPTEIDDKIPFGLVLKRRNGKSVNTRGYLNGSFNWNKVKVKCSHGSFKDGTYYYQPELLHKTDGRISIEFSMKKHPDVKQLIELRIPQPQDIEVLLMNDGALRPNIPVDYQLKVTFDNGKSYMQNNSGIPLKNYFASVWLNGELQDYRSIKLPPNKLKPMKRVVLELATQGYGAMTKQQSFPVKYDIKEVFRTVTYNGNNGYSGASGYDIEAPGENGTNGENGENAPHVKVYIKRADYPNEGLLHIIAQANNYNDQFWVHPVDGSFYIINRGGNGGNGGEGGKGGPGRDGDGKCEPGRGGFGGDGGNGGRGGNGGAVTIYCTESCLTFAELISVDNQAGYGGLRGSGGRGGQGGYDPDQSLLASILLRGNRGSRGSKGKNGSVGKQGPAKKIKVVSEEEIKKYFDEL